MWRSRRFEGPLAARKSFCDERRQLHGNRMNSRIPEERMRDEMTASILCGGWGSTLPAFGFPSSRLVVQVFPPNVARSACGDMGRRAT